AATAVTAVTAGPVRSGPGDAGTAALAAGGGPGVEVDDRYAVVGVAGRYPSARDVDAYWENLRKGRDTSAPGPPARPGGNPLAAGQRGHFVDGAADFDPDFFGVTAAQGIATDPQERLFTEVVWEALEDAGCTGSRLDALTTAAGAPRAVGVFAGVSSCDYALLAASARNRDLGTPAGGHAGLSATAAGLLSLTGPAQAVDTAECSALTAVHLAVEALRRGECAAAVAGGVELLLHPARARDGAGEGVGAVVLKPLSRALTDGDRIHAVLKDTYSRFAPPQSAPHAAGEESAPRASGVEETRRSTAARTGHAGAATGIAALTAAVLQVRHGVRLAPDGAGTPWPRATDAHGRRLPRTARVQVAADGGQVAGAVVEEHLTAPVPPPSPAAGEASGARRPHLVLLSAPTPAHLAATAGRLADWLDKQNQQDKQNEQDGQGEHGERDRQGGQGGDGAGRLAGVARALRGGRAALPCRIALLVHDTAQLLTELARVGDGRPADGGSALRWADLREGAIDPLALNEAPETGDFVAALWREGRLEQLRGLWLQGVDIDWAALETPAAGQGTWVVPPASVFLRRPLWHGAGTASQPEPAP
ncbi:beta-ketoacyl [acyl carrier protein] synthase domain-containing protein, partial [Streptomyces werraensis]|uniref:beta-ketoacyl [acyl carrier protein] synthase domain-containing protein n=1 Tax=Streptomyces werraensis TaxID=68284 RepID=UPI00369D0AA6